MYPLVLGNIELHLLWFVASGKALSCRSLEAYNGLMKKPCLVYMMSLIIIIIIMIVRMEMAQQPQHVQRTWWAPSCKNDYFFLLHWSIKAFMCLQIAKTQWILLIITCLWNFKQWQLYCGFNFGNGNSIQNFQFCSLFNPKLSDMTWFISTKWGQLNWISSQF